METYSIEAVSFLERWQFLGFSLLYLFWGGDYRYAQGLLYGCFNEPQFSYLLRKFSSLLQPIFFNQLHVYAIVHSTLNVSSEIFSSGSFASSFLEITHNVKLWLNRVVMVFSCLFYYRNMFLTLMIWRKGVTPLRLSHKEKASN